ncbi:MAG TPA: FISUMP domain-containing protein [Fibrobacteria bacterium]|nr:FISUMP domain-containing protein [Fibrobacteria bacterium]
MSVLYAGFDVDGRKRLTWNPPILADRTAAARSAAASSDTVYFSWNGRLRKSIIPPSLTVGAVGTVRIDTSTKDSDIRWNTSKFDYGKLVDSRDGQVYRTITLGSQIWMAENLNFKVDSSASALGSVDSAAKYGRLYQWTAAMGLPASNNATSWGGSDVKRRGVCPVGWHIPSNQEWSTLIRHVDPGATGLGTKLFSIGGWKDVTVPSGSTEAFGFRALPAGYLCCGDFQHPGTPRYLGMDTWWWSSSEGSTPTTASNFSKSGIASGEKTLGYSVRCLKDSAAPITKPDTIIDTISDLAKLPKDQGGVNLQVPKGTKTKPVNGTPDSATYGYYVYLPSGALDSSTSFRFPLLISLHGSGYSENAGLSAQMGICVEYLIANNKWHPNYPFIVATPQNHADNGWNTTELNNYIAYMVAHYPVDPKRIYMVGASMGAIGIYSYLTSMGSKSLVAAAVPIAGTASTTNAKNVSVPVWAFHGAKDAAVSPTNDKAFIAAVQAAHPELDAKITMFPNLEHEWNIWYYVYYPDGIAEETVKDGRTNVDPAYAPYDRGIYDWMLLHKKP